ncbi:MAG: D-glycero-beta-D-manno-heptose-7-phosphate kinase [Candidatus Eremiobacteraeota bacterium]|nr:D-glycero-beta-D-manno-heptose-7-phosphate kinase [Candidatus Eremiobacteraeota bacterium]
MTPADYKQIIDGFSNKHILVIGDCMLDEWLWGKVSRISPEAPVPVVEVTNRTYTPGGAANVVNNLCSLGAAVSVAGVIGNDDSGKLLLKELESRGVDTRCLLTNDKRPTTTKTRIIAHHQQVVRADLETTDVISESISARLIEALENGPAFDAVLVSDYGKGVVNRLLMRDLVKYAKNNNIILTGGPKPANIDFFRRFHLVSLNEQEASNATGIKVKNGDTLGLAGGKLLANLLCNAILITRGEHGMSLFIDDGTIKHIPALATEVYDVSGAGDTVLATLTLALTCGAGLLDAVHLANYAAAVVVRKLGTATLTAEELIASSKNEG